MKSAHLVRLPLNIRRRLILVVDDQQPMRVTTRLLLEGSGYTVKDAASSADAIAILQTEPVDLLLTDVRMQPVDGIALTKHASEISPATQVIVMTAFGSIEVAVEAMRAGASDFLTKPFKEDELLHKVKIALERAQLISTVKVMTNEFNKSHGLSALVGTSKSMRELTSMISRVAQTDATVLVQGESGTGKELVARAIHTLSRRNSKPFVPVNCAAISETLLESELFGHAKGAFTGALRARNGLFEEADGGTLFIDEVTETSQAFQTKLLRALQEGEVRRVGESTSIQVDVRIVAATNRKMETEVAQKRFREDLFYRLNVVELNIPPLRERLDDVPGLALHFLARLNLRSRTPKRISASALEKLGHYHYPGNVRELENLIEQAVALSESDELQADDFSFKRASSLQPGQVSESGSSKLTLEAAVEEAERKAIVAALEKSPRDLAQVAEWLGISQTTLWRKMRRLGIKGGAEPSLN